MAVVTLTPDRRLAASEKKSEKATTFEQRGRIPLSTSLLLLLPLAVLLGWTYFFPIAKLLIKSITEPTLTLQHYLRLWEEPLYLRIILRTAWISFATTIITLLLGYPIAVLM